MLTSKVVYLQILLRRLAATTNITIGDAMEAHVISKSQMKLAKQTLIEQQTLYCGHLGKPSPAIASQWLLGAKLLEGGPHVYDHVTDGWTSHLLSQQAIKSR